MESRTCPCSGFFNRKVSDVERYIETERLIIKPLSQEDAPEVFEWASDKIVNRFLPYQPYKSVAQVRKWIASIEDEDYEFGFFLKDGGKCIGSGSIGRNQNGDYDLGYNFNRNYWGRGYATEAGKALIDWAYHQLGARSFASNHAIENVASGRVIEKCGFQFSHYGQYSRFDGSETFDAKFYRMILE